MKLLGDLASNAITLAIVAVLGVCGVVVAGAHQFTRSGPHDGAFFFDIPKGQTISGVAAGLADLGAITSEIVFRYGAKFTGQDTKIKHGTFQIDSHASMSEILETITSSSASRRRYVATYHAKASGGELTLIERLAGSDETIEIAKFLGSEDATEPYLEILNSGIPIEFRVVITEGLTVWQVVEAINDAEFLEGEAGLMPDEGSLAPDTYEVARGAAADDLISRMIDSQNEIMEEEWAQRPDDSFVATPREALILASIIEKETGVSSERGLVASVFVNRLQTGMRLQSDPTVVYGITEGRGVLGRGLRQSELKRKTPFNTYEIDGLPPTPIANPGRAAIRAALNPAESDFLFFVADGTGSHAFAKTYDEHRANVRKWRQIERERQSESGN